MPNFLVSLVKYLIALLEVALTLRLVLKLLVASSYAVIVQLLYKATDWLLYPFKGIFQPVYFSNGGLFDRTAVAAMVGYALAAFILVKLLNLFFKD